MQIKDIGRQLFAEIQSFDNFSAEDMQALLIVKALGVYLGQKGMEPNFTVNVNLSKFKRDYEGPTE